MTEGSLTHKKLAEILGVSETTVKSYRRKFPDCIPVANKGKPIRFTLEAEPICAKIRDYFAIGMSVEDVGKRLSQEFGWKSPKQSYPKKMGNAPKKASVIREEHEETSPHVQAALGSMAKSMVAMTQRQEDLLSAMKNIEELLREIGLKGFSAPDVQEIIKTRNIWSEEEQNAVRQLKNMADEMYSIVDISRRVLDENKAMNAILLKERKILLEGSEKIITMASSLGGNVVPPAANEPAPSVTGKVINLNKHPLAANKVVQEMPATLQADVSDVPRSLLTLPIVIKLNDGTYTGAGGKTMGRVSINDIKAMLAEVFTPPDNFYLRWERNIEGWWAVFEQPTNEDFENGLVLKVLLHEITSTRGISVLEAKKLMHNGAETHPAEFGNFVTGIGR